MTYEDLKKVNEQIRTTDIKGKEYAEVPQRIKAFRMLHPEGYIKTEIVSLDGGVCVMRAEVGIDDILLGVGHAYEKEGSTFINRTSYIENCETSAVGRALGMAGIGIDTSVASAEEVQNAQLNQPVEKKYITALKAAAKKANKAPGELTALKGCRNYDDITMQQWQAAMKELGAE